jgi:hypothetical protein
MEPKSASPMVPLRRASMPMCPSPNHRHTIRLTTAPVAAASSLSVQDSSLSVWEQPRAY